MRIWIAAAALAALGCKGEKSETPKEPEKRPATEVEIEADAAAPKVELLESPVARRLHVDRAEASSFLWNDWNRFQENYHPLYLVDDDPTTAWVEGADGPGAGEWIRLHLSPNDAATAIQIRLRNGYHKSKSLFKKNARAREVTVVLHPSRLEKRFTLEDSMEWQTLDLSQPSGPLSALELRVETVYPGTKYADLCLSDARVEVTSRTPEDPAFEKAKLEKVNAWKASRLEAARLFASTAARDLPVGGSYRVTDKRPVAGSASGKGAIGGAIAMLAAAPAVLGEHREVLARATDALEGGFEGWTPLSVAIKKSREVPAVDGLYVPDAYELAGESPPREDGYAMPLPGKLEFLTSSRVSTFESADKLPVAEALAGKASACEREDGDPHHFFFRPPEGGDGVTRELLVIQCGRVAERDSYYGYATLQLLEYDERGRLIAAITPRGVTTYEWSEAGDKLAGGQRLRSTWKSELIADRLIARK